jgi:hypothetical protein
MISYLSKSISYTRMRNTVTCCLMSECGAGAIFAFVQLRPEPLNPHTVSISFDGLLIKSS